MDASQRPGRRAGGIRIAGVNVSGTPQLQGISQLAVPEQVDITTEKFSQVNEDVQRGYQVLLDNLNARTQSRAAELAGRGRPQSQANIQGLVETAIGAYGAIQEQRAKRKAEQQKTQEQQNEQIAYQMLEYPLAQLQETIANVGDEEGYHTAVSHVERTLEDIEGLLPPPIYQQVRQFAFSQVSEVRQRQSTRQYESAVQLQQNQLNAAKSQLAFQATNLRAALRTAPTPEAASGILDNVMELFNSVATNFPVSDRLQLYADFLEDVAADDFLGAQQRAEVSRRQEGIQVLSGKLQTLRDTYGNDPDQFRLALLSEAQPYGLEGLVDSLRTNEEVQQYYRSNRLQEIAYDEAMRDAERTKFAQENPEYISNLSSVIAFQILNGGAAGRQLRSRIEADPSSAQPFERQGLQTAIAWERGREQYQDDLAKLAQLDRQVETALRQRDPRSLGNARYQWDTIEGNWVEMPVSAVINSREAVTSAGGVQSFTQNIQRWLGGRGNIGLNANGQEVLYVSPGVSAGEVAAIVNERTLAERRIGENVARFQAEGFNLQNPTDQTFITPIREMYERQDRELRTRIEQQGSSLPNFNSGGEGAPDTPPIQPLAQVNGHVVPFSSTHRVAITDYYARNSHPGRGGRPHHGIDLDVVTDDDSNVQILSVQGGRVIRASNWGNYGGSVLVQAPDGRIEQYSHLRSFSVREGQNIPPGTAVGLLGGGRNDEMAGRSSGRHLHFQVWVPGADFSNPRRDTIPPLDYLKSINYNVDMPRGQGLPPRQGNQETRDVPRGGDATGTGSWSVPIVPAIAPVIYDPETQTTVRSDQIYTNANPRRAAQAPIHRSAYPPRANPTHNYGYSVIARDTGFARAIAELANHLDIPGQWLADVMAYEVGSSFNPRRAGGDGNNYYGLIQMSETNLRNMGLSVYSLRNMSRADYVRRVMRPYFEEFRGRINTIEDLYAAILGGTRLFSRDPQSRGNIGDSNAKFRDHVRRLGHHVGRRYRTSYDSNLTSSLPVHTQTTPGCPVCTRQAQSIGFITPHQAVG